MKISFFFPSKGFILLALAFRDLILTELMFIYGVKYMLEVTDVINKNKSDKKGRK